MSNEARTTLDLQEPAAAALLVEYQPGSVVSRTVLKKSGGTVTLFAFDAGEGLSEHTTLHEALLLGLEGAADISIAGVVHRLEAFHLLRLPASVPHGVKAVTRFKMGLVMIKA